MNQMNITSIVPCTSETSYLPCQKQTIFILGNIRRSVRIHTSWHCSVAGKKGVSGNLWKFWIGGDRLDFWLERVKVHAFGNHYVAYIFKVKRIYHGMIHVVCPSLEILNKLIISRG
ncbi:hypothetical protein BDV28DRAFT_129425 [Aspergillus coremiiformis]|uniref:Uncharacterized protein n=1 Tax=Aspergillus coremiiformis TaxID=138285 RepID=A0A5N6ZC34_9EURO|nr:hypothetical protein BDV28DRAFT_129425 [Aspergillus coremiiformis]